MHVFPRLWLSSRVWWTGELWLGTFSEARLLDRSKPSMLPSRPLIRLAPCVQRAGRIITTTAWAVQEKYRRYLKFSLHLSINLMPLVHSNLPAVLMSTGAWCDKSARPPASLNQMLGDHMAHWGFWSLKGDSSTRSVRRPGTPTSHSQTQRWTHKASYTYLPYNTS